MKTIMVIFYLFVTEAQRVMVEEVSIYLGKRNYRRIN